MFPITVRRFVTASISSLWAEVKRKTAPPTTKDDTNISAMSRSTRLFLDKKTRHTATLEDDGALTFDQ